MAEYMTTKEVAQYLRLNEKKVYALVAEGQLPATRISGKWLFPKHIVDQWMEHNTRYPAIGLMGSVLDDMLVIQGSDDWLFSRVASRFQDSHDVAVVSAPVGSLAGLAALASGKAHIAGCHVDNDKIRQVTGGSSGCLLISLFEREQGLMFDGDKHPGVDGLKSVVDLGLKFGQRQALSGTYRLAERLFREADASLESLDSAGPYTSHLDLAIAIRNGEADAGLGTRLAAEQCGLQFITLHVEPFKLVVPSALGSHPRIVAFLDYVVSEIREASLQGVSGYSFGDLGRMETVGGAAGSGV